ncbi:MAG: hypothetical protein RMI94_11555 [Bryobacterales bacterium]|nr:hypothetical protein [Bryobacterales bacterium]
MHHLDPERGRHPPAAPLSAKTGRLADGRDRLPLVDRGGAGILAALADGMLDEHPGMIEGAFIHVSTMLSFPQPF